MCIRDSATMVTGKEAFEKRAENHPQHDGHRAGIIVYDEETGELAYRVGAFYLNGEKIVGGWAEVYRKDQRQSTRVEVPFDEYAGRKKDGSLNRQWSAKPATKMCIRDRSRYDRGSQGVGFSHERLPGAPAPGIPLQSRGNSANAGQ